MNKKCGFHRKYPIYYLSGGFTLNVDKYNWEEHNHFITEDCREEIDFGEGKKNIYPLDGTTVLVQKDKEVQMAVNEFEKFES